VRTSGAIYKKLREVKYRRLVELYRRLLRRAPELCKYNKAYRIQTDNTVREIRLCMLHQPENGGFIPHLLDICQEINHCNQCNAFVSIHTKETVRAAFEQDLANENVKAKRYPEICALEWVLEQSSSLIPPLSWIERVYLFLKSKITIWPLS